MLILARKLNESIMIGDDIVVTVIDIQGDQVRLGIEAPKKLKVYRREVYQAIKDENHLAALSLSRGNQLGNLLDQLVNKTEKDKNKR